MPCLPNSKRACDAPPALTEERLSIVTDTDTPVFSRRWPLWVVPALALATGLVLHASGSAPALAITAALTVWCAGWWILEPVSPAVTALLPLSLLPMTGVLTPQQVAQSYGNELILLLLGGFILSLAVEKSGAHRRLALGMVRAVGGGSGRAVLWGFMIASAGLSMWISNAATTLLLLPVALAVLADYRDARLAVPLILGIAYAASIGGLGTPIGTPPNLVFMSVYEEATGQRFGFLEWMAIGVPVVVLLVPLMALWLGRGLKNAPPAPLPHLPAWSKAEQRVLSVFAITALAWVFREVPFGGWSTWLNVPHATDTGVALCGALAMLLMGNGRGERILEWQDAERLPWGVLLLFGGGIALSMAFQSSGLSDVIAFQLRGLSTLPLLLMLVVLVGGVILLSEIASNTATAVLLMPIMAAAAQAVGADPALLMFPAVMAASIGFMLPVATAPNAIAYGSGKVPAQRMLREGAVMDVLGALVVCAVCYVAFS
jgi:sodium-dependent dicarboxylate transporter 2/3/5